MNGPLRSRTVVCALIAIFLLTLVIVVSSSLSAFAGMPGPTNPSSKQPMGGFTDTPTNTPVPCSQFYFASSPNVGTSDNFLSGVAAVSASDVWAVGYYYNGSTYQTLA